jgi:hypothetical protein
MITMILIFVFFKKKKRKRKKKTKLFHIQITFMIYILQENYRFVLFRPVLGTIIAGPIHVGVLVKLS